MGEKLGCVKPDEDEERPEGPPAQMPPRGPNPAQPQMPPRLPPGAVNRGPGGQPLPSPGTKQGPWMDPSAMKQPPPPFYPQIKAQAANEMGPGGPGKPSYPARYVP